ncbi:YrzI family small protein [Ectobacillus polymachus]
MRLQLLIFTITIEKRERKIEEYQYDQYVKQKMDELKDRYLFFNL